MSYEDPDDPKSGAWLWVQDTDEPMPTHWMPCPAFPAGEKSDG